MNKFFRKCKPYGFFLILLLGLTPLLWYKPGFLAFGHDMGYPLGLIGHFRDRLFVWTERLSLGLDQSMSIGAFFIHGFEALIKWLGFSVQVTQKISFVFWFVTPGLAIYYFIRSLGLQKKLSFLPLIASIFYMFNHFLLQGWFIAERTKFSILVALPLVLSFLIRGLQQKMSLLKAVILINLILFFFNGGGGQGLPLYGGLIVSSGICLVYFTLLEWRKTGVGVLRRVFLLATLILLLFAILNFYWILPLSRFALVNYSRGLALSGGTAGVLTWTRMISEQASFLNLFRLQGIPSGQYPYGSFFLENPLMVTLDFIWPILAFISIFLAKSKKEKKYVLFFVLLALVSMVFTAGTHPPTGKIYEGFVKYIPFFVVFRTPFYKFGYGIWFAYAFLISFTVNKLFRKLKKKWVYSSLSFISIIFILLYNYPFFTGNFFNWNPPLSTMVQVPNYIFEFGEWVDSLEKDERVLMLPPLNEGWKADAYNWKYWSLSTIPSLLTRKSVIANSGQLSKNQGALIGNLYSALWDKDEILARKLLSILNIKYFLLRKDVFYELEWCPTIPPEEYEERLKDFDWIKLDHKFGEWFVYRLEIAEFLPHFFLPQFYSFAEENLNAFLPFSFSESSSKEAVLSPQEKDGLPLELANNIYISAQPHPGEEESTQLSEARFLPDSKLYTLVRWEEERLEKKIMASNDLGEIIDLNLSLANKRLGEIEKLVERRKERWEKKTEEKRDEVKEMEEKRLMEETWRRFGERLNKALGLLKDVENQGGDVLEVTYQILKYVELFQRKLIYFFRDKSLHIDIPDRLENLLAIRQGLEKKAWVTSDELEKRYFIEVPRGGEYELFVKERDVLYGYVGEMFKEDPFHPMNFALDGKQATVSGKERENDWLSFEKYKLEEGRHQLQIFLPRLVNLAKQENFTLSAEKGADLVLALDDFLKRGRSFNISFDYKVEGENLPRLIIAQKITEGGNDYISREVDMILPKSEYDLKFSESFTINPQAKQAGIKLFFEEYGDAQLYVKNFQVTIDWRPEVVLRTTADNVEERRVIPKITFRKINPTRYEVWVEEAKGPYLLVFSESFHPGWRVYLENTGMSEFTESTEVLASYFDGEIREEKHRDDLLYKEMFDTWGKRPISEDRHLLTNGYANSWYILPEDVGGERDYRLIIEFWPQRLFYMGLFISGITLISCLGFFGLLKIRKLSR